MLSGEVSETGPDPLFQVAETRWSSTISVSIKVPAVTTELFAGDTSETAGAVPSNVKAKTEARRFPKASVAVTVTLTAPSIQLVVFTVKGATKPTSPEPLFQLTFPRRYVSVTAKSSVVPGRITAPAEGASRTMDGGVRSTKKWMTSGGAMFPTPSVATIVRLWSPSAHAEVLMSKGEGSATGPEPLFQLAEATPWRSVMLRSIIVPAPMTELLAGATSVTVGGGEAISKWNETAPELPARSSATISTSIGPSAPAPVSTLKGDTSGRAPEPLFHVAFWRFASLTVKSRVVPAAIAELFEGATSAIEGRVESKIKTKARVPPFPPTSLADNVTAVAPSGQPPVPTSKGEARAKGPPDPFDQVALKVWTSESAKSRVA